jgi:hypothetical protein
LSGHSNCSDSDKRFGSLPNKKKFKFWEELKMKNLTIICFLVVFGAGSAAFATTTHQMWNFDDQTSLVPDVVDNQFGPPVLMVNTSPAGGWVPDPSGQGGAWALSGEIDVIIPNDPIQREFKVIQLLLTWRPGNLGMLPSRPLVGVSADPMTAMTMGIINEPIAGTPWTQSLYSITIWPNPAEEWIAIKGDIVVDKLDITTECIPEPATMGLLGLGSIALLRNRRKRS